jgi:hypothetical protein
VIAAHCFTLEVQPFYSTPDFGTWTDNAPDNSRMFLRDVSTENLYTLDVAFP